MRLGGSQSPVAGGLPRDCPGGLCKSFSAEMAPVARRGTKASVFFLSSTTWAEISGKRRQLCYLQNPRIKKKMVENI